MTRVQWWADHVSRRFCVVVIAIGLLVTFGSVAYSGVRDTDQDRELASQREKVEAAQANSITNRRIAVSAKRTARRLAQQVERLGAEPVVDPENLPEPEPEDDALPGPAGATGPEGSRGPRGPRGFIGPVGPIGPSGPAGKAGDAGAPGVSGSQGNPGDRGPQGPKGDKGDKGDPGPQGEQGPVGAQGEPGAQGTPGTPGAQGPQGSPAASFSFTYAAVTYVCTDPDGDLAYECQVAGASAG